jgi:hypothetical protein
MPVESTLRINDLVLKFTLIKLPGDLKILVTFTISLSLRSSARRKSTVHLSMKI